MKPRDSSLGVEEARNLLATATGTDRLLAFVADEDGPCSVMVCLSPSDALYVAEMMLEHVADHGDASDEQRAKCVELLARFRGNSWDNA